MDRAVEECKMLLVENPKLREDIYVHQVYNEIASHFSNTRYKPWPVVDEFLKSRAKGSFGLDVGCGNGKYFGINQEVFIVGSDHSEKLIELADANNKAINSSAMVADGLHLPHFDNSFDFAISIAVIHHFSTPERRIQAVQKILAKLTSEGEALIYVWALEQQSSRRGWSEGMPQDILVPWVLQKEKKKNKSQKKNLEDKQEKLEDKEEEPETKMRYYHLYKKGELEDDVIKAGGKVVKNGYQKDNWWAIISKA